MGMAASTSLRQDLVVPAGYAVGTSRCTEGMYESVCQWRYGHRNACVCANVLWYMSVCACMMLCKCVMMYECDYVTACEHDCVTVCEHECVTECECDCVTACERDCHGVWCVTMS